MKKQQENIVIASATMAKLEPFIAPAQFEFEWHEKTRRRDKDNVAFAKKFILDALQIGGWLRNDNNNFVISFTDTFVYDKEQKVVVTIIENDNQ